MINKLFANVRYNMIFRCKRCKATAVGDTVHTSYQCGSAQELMDALGDLECEPDDMPVGWSYNGEYNCGCAKKEDDDGNG